MKLSRPSVTFIVMIMIFALGGLVALQAKLLMDARDHKEQAFRQNVNMVLGKVAQELETGEVVQIALQAEPGLDSTEVHAFVAQAEIRTDYTEDSTAHGFKWSTSGSLPVTINDGKLQYRLDAPQRVKIQVFDPMTGKDLVMVDSLKMPGEYGIDLKDSKYARGSYVFRVSCDSGSATLEIINGSPTGAPMQHLPGQERRMLVTKVIDQLNVLQFKPIERRIDSLKLDSSLARNFREAGIETPYAYGIIASRSDSLRLARPPHRASELRDAEFRVNLFPMDIFAPRSQLVVYFPEQSGYVRWQVLPLMAATTLFMLVITGCFAYTVRTIVRQKRFAAVTVDFINNMTHEFKTPISTVALASEAILTPEVTGSPERVERFAKMIQEENLRMRRQVEKILQMAALEEKDFELTLTEVDMNDVAGRAVENMTLHVETRHGSIAADLQATNPLVRADALHMANIVHNLLDNANKYSPDTPNIVVSTRNDGTRLIISVKDNGLGIAPKDQKMIFDKFFRVSSGNIHDVKGFGIGLAYVKLMTTAQGGEIDLKSAAGQGTTVELSFPTIPVSTGKMS